MDKLKSEYDLVVHWRSFMLRPPGSPPMPPERQAMIENSREQFKARVRAEYGLELNQGPFGTQSYQALVLAKYAQVQGKGEEYEKRVLRAYWQEGQDIGDPAVLKAILAEVGLEADKFEELVANPEYSEAVTFDISEAREYGINSVPALIFAEKYFVSGAQPLAFLRQAVDKVLAEA